MTKSFERESLQQESLLSLYDMRLLCEIVKLLNTPQSLDKVQLALERKGYKKFDDLSREIIRLEKKMKVKHGLIVEAHGAQGSSATPMGRDIANALEELRLQYRTSVESIFPARRPRVVVGMTNWVTTYLMTGVLTKTDFFAKNPKTDLKILEGEAEDLQVMLKEHDIDFAIAPASGRLLGVIEWPLCRLRRVLKFRRDSQDFARLMDLSGDEAVREKQVLAALQDLIVLVPLRRVMPDIEAWLPKPDRGRIIKLPQAAIRQEWARRGLGVAIVHEDRTDVGHHEEMASVLLPETIGWTELCFYFRGRNEHRDELTPQAESLVAAIQKTYGDAKVMGDGKAKKVLPS